MRAPKSEQKIDEKAINVISHPPWGKNLNRISIARWVLSKLLGAYLVYLLLFWLFPRLQIDWANMIFYEVYGWLVGIISVASLISYVLLPPPKKLEETKPVEVEE